MKEKTVPPCSHHVDRRAPGTARDPRRGLLRQRQRLRRGAGTHLREHVVLRGPVVGPRAARAVQEGPDRTRERAADPWARRIAARFPQCLPPSRRPVVHRARGRSASAVSAAPTTPGRTRWTANSWPRPTSRRLTDEAGAPIDRYRFGLVPVALTEWLGYAWVCLSDTPPPFDDVVAETTVRLGDSDAINRYGIGGLDVGHRVVYDVAANWKLIVENFMECYHCSYDPPRTGRCAARVRTGHGRSGQYRPWRRIRFGCRRIHGRRLGRIRPAARDHRRPGPPLLRDHGQADGVHQPGPRPHHLPPDVSDVARRGPSSNATGSTPPTWCRRGGTCRTPWSCSTASTCRISTPASELSPRCRHGPTVRAACSFPPNITSRSSISG